jgi:hypothetical protein
VSQVGSPRGVPKGNSPWFSPKMVPPSGPKFCPPLGVHRGGPASGITQGMSPSQRTPRGSRRVVSKRLPQGGSVRSVHQGASTKAVPQGGPEVFPKVLPSCGLSIVGPQGGPQYGFPIIVPQWGLAGRTPIPISLGSPPWIVHDGAPARVYPQVSPPGVVPQRCFPNGTPSSVPNGSPCRVPKCGSQGWSPSLVPRRGTVGGP